MRRLDRNKNDSEDGDDEDVKDKKGAKSGARKEDLVLNQYESQIAMEVVAPEDIPVGFEGTHVHTHSNLGTREQH